MTPHFRLARAIVIILAVTTLTAYAADRLVLRLAEEHQAVTAQLSMAAAMGGLFAGGLVALLSILILARGGSSAPK